MIDLKKEALKYLKNFSPVNKNEKQEPFEERTYPYGKINAIISHYSVEIIPLFENENMVERCGKGFDYMETADICPHKEMNSLYVVFKKKTPYKNKSDIVIPLMLGFVEYLKKEEH